MEEEGTTNLYGRCDSTRKKQVSCSSSLLVVDKTAWSTAKKKTTVGFELNTAAYDDLMVSMDVSTNGGRIAFQIVNNSTSDENPIGNAKIAWDRMAAKSKLSTAPRYMRLERDLINSKLAVGRNPDP